MRRYRRVLVIAAALAAVARTPSAWAGEPSPTEQLKAEIDRVVKTLEDPALQGDARGAERRALVRQIAALGTPGVSLERRGFKRDRKSTRLNSSHSQISDALFCLK